MRVDRGVGCRSHGGDLAEHRQESENEDDRSRRNRIAQGSGTDAAEINQLLKQFGAMAGMMQKMSGLGLRERMSAVQELTRKMEPSGGLRREKQRTKRGRFSNGMQFALLPKSTRGEAVRAVVTLRFGSLESLRGKSTAGEFAAALLDKGTARHTRQQLRDEFEKVVNFAIEHNDDTAVFVVEGLLPGSQIDDRQAPMAKPEAGLDMQTRVVGAAV